MAAERTESWNGIVCQRGVTKVSLRKICSMTQIQEESFARAPMQVDVTEFRRIRPSFLFIGADRCGSKTLHNIFRQHPDCFVPAIADPYFFDKNYDRGIRWYYELFANASPAAQAIGEFSHDYIHSREAAERIQHHLPDVKLLVSLRHPIERTFSSYAAAHSAGVIRTSFERALKEVPMLIGNSLYADKLDTYFDFFPPEQFKILMFDDLQASSRRFAEQAFEFVGLRTVDYIDYDERKSVLSKSRFPLSGTLSKIGANTLRKLGWVELLGKLKSDNRFRSLFYRPYAATERPNMDAATRKQLSEVFASQIDRLEKLIDRDLSHWRS